MSSQSNEDIVSQGPVQKTGAYMSNFAGTKEWAGGSSQIADFAGKSRLASPDNGTAGPKPSRHPEGVKGGNSSFPQAGSY